MLPELLGWLTNKKIQAKFRIHYKHYLKKIQDRKNSLQCRFIIQKKRSKKKRNKRRKEAAFIICHSPSLSPLSFPASSSLIPPAIPLFSLQLDNSTILNVPIRRVSQISRRKVGELLREVYYNLSCCCCFCFCRSMMTTTQPMWISSPFLSLLFFSSSIDHF